MTSYLVPLLGGALIGLSATVLLLANGKVAGISGILGGLLSPGSSENGWRLAFLGGLLAGGVVLTLVAPNSFGPPVSPGLAVPVASGLLVGFGTQLGGGCTSGHGICGISRGSARSIVSTLTFMAAGGITVFLTHHVLGVFS